MGTLLDITGLRANTTAAFRQALYDQATAAGYDPSYIAAVLRLESNFNPAAINPGGHAAGILQWWDSLFPATAMAAGRPEVQWTDLPNMSAEEQVPFVIAYLQQATSAPLVTPTDYRLAVFMPAYVGASPDTVLGQRNGTGTIRGGLSLGTVYAQNAGLDTNGDGLITVGDVGDQIENLVADARTRAPIDLSDDSGDTLPPGGSIGGALPVLLVMSGLFFCPHCSARCPVKVVFERSEQPHHDLPHPAPHPAPKHA